MFGDKMSSRRDDNNMGLNTWSQDFVKVAKRGYTKNYLAGIQDHALHKYTFPDGRIYFEYEQTGFSDHGEVWFLALKDEKGMAISDSLWTREEAESATGYLPENLEFR